MFLMHSQWFTMNWRTCLNSFTTLYWSSTELQSWQCFAVSYKYNELNMINDSNTDNLVLLNCSYVSSSFVHYRQVLSILSWGSYSKYICTINKQDFFPFITILADNLTQLFTSALKGAWSYSLPTCMAHYVNQGCKYNCMCSAWPHLHTY